MNERNGITMLSDGAVVSPFPRLRDLLDGMAPGHKAPIELTIGEPREQMPGFVIEKLGEVADLYAKYPPIKGTDELRDAISDWAARRYGEAARPDPAREILPLNGSREGLLYGVFPAVGRKSLATGQRPAVLMPNPFYQTYAGAALAANCEPVYLNATRETGFLPDLDALASQTELLARTVAFYLCTPSNPEGAVASRNYFARALELARAYDFMLFADECYSEIYAGDAPPVGALQVAADMARRGSGTNAAAMSDGPSATNAPATGKPGVGPFANLLVFNSLSKRSNLPGLRSGFCAGDATFIATLTQVRNLIGPQMPLPTQHLSAAVWAEEQHVGVTRQAYREKFDIADEVLGGRYGYRRPAGGFFLWLDMNQFGGGIDATVTLWKGCGVKVIPGAFLAQAARDSDNPGNNYIRVALVHDAAMIQEALERIVSVLPE